MRPRLQLVARLAALFSLGHAGAASTAAIVPTTEMPITIVSDSEASQLTLFSDRTGSYEGHPRFHVGPLASEAP